MTAIAILGASAQSTLTMSSREIAELTGKELSNVHRDIRSMLIELYGKEHVERVVPEQYRNRHSEYIRENAEAILSAITGDDSKRNHQDKRGFSWERDTRGYITTFRLDHNHTMTLVAGYNVQLRKTIIDRWQELESQQQAPALNPANFTRLQLIELAMQAEQERLASEAKAQLLEAKVTDMEPQVQAFERIAKSDGSLCITDAAKTLQVQPRELTQTLQTHNWIYRRPMGSGWLAYQDRIQSGHLEHKVTTGEKSDGREWTSTQVRVTPKGLARLAQVLAQN